MFLKDSWCPVTEELELGVYRKLNNSPAINFVATAVAGNEERTDLTVTQDLVAAGKQPRLAQRSHHRLVLREIGRPLESYATQRELVQVVSDALDGSSTLTPCCTVKGTQCVSQLIARCIQS